MIHSNLPSGTVTFLFTDIEGSTQLWEQHPEAMQTVLKRHDELLRGAIETQDGYVFKTVGDAFCAAFADAHQALNAALAAQRALIAEVLSPEIGTLRVRIGLHTGSAEERDNDYFGPSVNRVARLQSTASGGQILLSLSTQELVRDDLPAGVSLIHLGQFRLKDLFRPEQIYQVVANDLPSSFPPLRTLESTLHNLPTQATPFIGRKRELAAVLSLLRLEDVRLVTLTGPGGMGKTRLSLQVAADLIEEFEHGVWFVELAALRDPEWVLPTIAATLKVKENPNETLVKTLTAYLAEKQMLLVLDNFEQIVEASPQVGELLKATKRLKIITSSREVLRVYGEHDYSVPPLGLPEKKHKQTVAVLSQYEAVRLFIDRAKAAKSSFEITEENAPAIAEICARLDGLPLAIELAAARSRMLTPQSILERLSNRLNLLTGGARNLPARQQTLRGAVDWSYDLLNDAEKKLFARLSVFVSGWTFDAADAVCAVDLELDILRGLESLLEKSLIHSSVGADDETRFLMLETIRDYALEKFEQAASREQIRNAHASYYGALAERHNTDALRRATDATLILAQLTAEQDNLRAMFEWLLKTEQVESTLKASAALWGFWGVMGQTKEGRAWLTQGLSIAQNVPAKVKADALRVAANMSADIDPALNLTYLEEALILYREIRDDQGVAACLNNLASHFKSVKQDYQQAQAFYIESLQLAKKMGDEHASVPTLWNLAMLCLRMKLPEQATLYMNESLVIARRLKSMERLGTGLAWAGKVAYFTQRYPDALGLLQESLSIAYQAHAIVPIVNLTRDLSWLAGIQQNYVIMVQLLAFSETLRAETEWMPDLAMDDTEKHLQAARDALDAEAFDTAWAAGTRMTLDEGAQFALAQKWRA